MRRSLYSISPTPIPRPPPSTSWECSHPKIPGSKFRPSNGEESTGVSPTPTLGKGPYGAEPQAEVWGEGRRSTQLLQSQQPRSPSGVHGLRDTPKRWARLVWEWEEEQSGDLTGLDGWRPPDNKQNGSGGEAASEKDPPSPRIGGSEDRTGALSALKLGREKTEI